MQELLATSASSFFVLLLAFLICLILAMVMSFALAWYLRSKKLNEAVIQLQVARVDLASAQANLEALDRRLQEELNESRKLQEVEAEHLKLQVRFEELKQRQEAERELLQETRNSLFKDFELSARKLFENSQDKLNATSKQGLETTLKPFKDQLAAFNKRVEDVYHKENSQRNQLVGQIAELQKQTQAISAEANNLASALKGENKTQGDWGELILERLLEQSGLSKGREYETQSTYKNEAGKNLRPDVIVRLPDEKIIVIDSKVSLLSFERWSNADNKSEREKALKEHVESIRMHIRNLSSKRYEQLESVNGLDFVFLFMPIEAAYVIAIQSAPELFKEAYEKNIVLVSPSGLMVALRTVETIWRYDKQNKNAQKIAQSAGRLYDQFVLFVESLDDIGRHLNRAGASYDLSRKRLSSGRGNLMKRARDLQEWGAKTSKQLTNTEEFAEQENIEYEPTSGVLTTDEVKTSGNQKNLPENKKGKMKTSQADDEPGLITDSKGPESRPEVEADTGD